MLSSASPGKKRLRRLLAIFREQQSWADDKEPAARAARLGGLSEARAEACLADGKRLESISAGRPATEKAYGAGSTPTFFIDSMNVEGAGPKATSSGESVL